MIWQSGQLANYYYGVRGSEATVARPAYKADSSLLLQAGVSADYPLNAHWSINARAVLTRLADEISDSPIVEDDYIVSGFIGVGYRF